MLKSGISIEVKVILILGAISSNARFGKCACPEWDGWNNADDKCLKVYEDEFRWTSASDTCKEKSGNLVSISNQNVQETLLEMTKQGTYWTGGHIPALVFKTYFNRCLDGHGFRNSSCFQIHAEHVTWNEATNICGQMGGHLATILDEEANIFVGNSMEEMTSKRNLSSAGQSPVSYWIDGSSDDGSSDFYDKESKLLEYTNLVLPVPRKGKRCLEAFLKQEDVPPKEEPDVDKMAKEADDQAMKEAIKSLPTGLPPGILPPDDDDDDDSQKERRKYDPKFSAPKYNALDCDERRMAVCEFPLKTIESQNKSSDADEDESSKPNIKPSRVQSCKLLALLSLYSDKSCVAVGDGNDNAISADEPTSVMSAYVGLKNGYYIFQSNESPKKSNDNATVETIYDLTFCEVENLKETLSNESAYSKQHFQWTQPNGTNDQSIVKLGLLEDENIYNGPCITMSDNGRWNTSRCSQSYKFFCEYTEEAVKNHFCEDNSNKSWCNGNDDNLQQLKTESSQLLEELQLGSRDYIMDGSSGVSRLRNLTTRATLLMDSISRTMSTKRSIENFTSNILKSASILLNPNLSYFANSRKHIRSIVTSLNNIAEYSADLLKQIWKNKRNDSNYNDSDAWSLSVNASGLHLHVAVFAGNTTNGTFFNHSEFDSTNGASMTMMLTDEQKRIAESEGATIINIHYEMMGTETYSPRSLSAIAEMKGYNPVTYPRRKEFYMLASDLQTATLRINGESVPTNVKFAMAKNELITDFEILEDSEMCAFLVDDKESPEPGIHWSTEGCRILPNDDVEKYHCECNHTTDFAILLLVFEPLNDFLDGHRAILSVFATVGHILSLVCLLISIILFTTLKREMKSDRRLIHIHLFIALFLANVALLISQLTSTAGMVIGIDDTTDGNTYTSCIVLTFFNHLLLLTSIFWMLIEGVVIYRKIVVVLSSHRKAFNNVYYLIGWGIPLLISLVAVFTGMFTDIDYHTEGCWLSVKSGMIWAFAGPAIAIILANSVVLILVLRVAMRTQKRKVARRAGATDSDKSKLTKLAYLQTAARGLVVLTPLLGLTWMIGLLIFHVAIAYVFVILNAFQGVSIFICYCVFNPEIRAALDMKWKHYKARHFTPMHEERPLANSESSDAKPAGWIKSKLLMRLSFSVGSNSRALDKFNSMQKNSDVIDEKDGSEQTLRGGKRNSSRPESRTSSSDFSNPSSSCASVTNESVASMSKKLRRKKKTAKVEPISVNENDQYSNKRPSTADDTFGKPRGTDKPPKHRTRNCSESWSNDPTNQTNTGKFPYDNEVDTSDERRSNASLNNKEKDGTREKNNNANESEEFENDIYTTELPKPQLTAIIRKPSEVKCDLCSRDYYNAFENDIPVRLYSNNYTRKNKSKKCTRDEEIRSSTRADTCISRCCPTCHPPVHRKRAPKMITVYGTQKTSYKNKPYLEVMDVNDSKARYLDDSRRRRPSSGISRDSGILPDDIGDYDTADPI